ncbi:hypothetical protein D3C71_1478260 [compost metagenome]
MFIGCSALILKRCSTLPLSVPTLTSSPNRLEVYTCFPAVSRANPGALALPSPAMVSTSVNDCVSTTNSTLPSCEWPVTYKRWFGASTTSSRRSWL